MLGEKEEWTQACNECGELFFFESSIETHKIHAHKKSVDDNTTGDNVGSKTSVVTEENKNDEDEEKLEKGRNILNILIRKPGSKKKLRMTSTRRTSPHKTLKGMNKTKLQCRARIANSSQGTIDNESTVVSDDTKSASEIEKTLPDINPPGRITRSKSIIKSQTENEDGNETIPSLEMSKVTKVTSGTKHRTRSQSSEDSAQKNNVTPQPSPASVLTKISRIVTRSQTTEDDGDKKEIINVDSKKTVENRPECRMTRSHHIASAVELSQPSVSNSE